jgi:hypothetical protein
MSVQSSGSTQLSDHHPGSVRCFRTVPSVAQCRVMSSEEASGVNFPSKVHFAPPARNNERGYSHSNLP